MKKIREFNFEKSRPVTWQETEAYRRAIEAKLGVKRPPRGRPAKTSTQKYQPVYIRLHPKVVKWARSEAKRRRIGYQTVINETLLKKAA